MKAWCTAIGRAGAAWHGPSQRHCRLDREEFSDTHGCAWDLPKEAVPPSFERCQLECRDCTKAGNSPKELPHGCSDTQVNLGAEAT